MDKQRCYFRDNNNRVRSGVITGTAIGDDGDYYKIIADRLHIWETENDLLHYAHASSVDF